MTRLDREARVTIKTLVSRGTTNTAVAGLLGVTEGSVRYHVSRMVTGAVDGRGMKPFKAAPQAEAIEHWRQSQQDGALNLAVLHTWLMAEHGYDGSLRSVQRFWAKVARGALGLTPSADGGARSGGYHQLRQPLPLQ